jgi:hypothetical protein
LSKDQSSERNSDLTLNGRLLLYFPEHSNHNGLSEDETNGFFSTCDDPPWDTWIDFVLDPDEKRRFNYLISWIPPQFVSTVTEGMKVESELLQSHATAK